MSTNRTNIALVDAAIEKALAELPGWAYDKHRRALFRRLRFTDFQAAFGMMVQVALEAEKTDHHPEWSNVYNQVEVWLTTHDAGGVTQRDVAMARYIDRLVADRHESEDRKPGLPRT